MSLKLGAVRALGVALVCSCVILPSGVVSGPVNQSHLGEATGTIGRTIVPTDGGVFYELAQAAPAGNAAAAEAPEVSEQLRLAGEGLYIQYCVACHRAQGEGDGAGAPALARNSRLADEARLIRQVLQGGDYMPGFGARLTDAEIAAIATYIRNSWANEFGPVTEEQVAAIR